MPKTRIYCSDASVIGTEFFVYDFAEGKTFRDPGLVKEVESPDERREVYRNMARVLATLHSTDYDSVGLGNLGSKAEEFIPHRT